MADKNCPGRRYTAQCPLAWLSRRQELEEMPMARIRVEEEPGEPRPVPQSCGCGQLAELLAQQNKLLCDILGAVSSLTAAQLALCRKEQS